MNTLPGTATFAFVVSDFGPFAGRAMMQRDM
jgi:hypothetical protein